MKGLPFWFATCAILSVLVGMSYGIYMAAIQDFTTAPAHAHLNLLGFVLGMMFAFYYSMIPQAVGRLAWAQFWLHQVGVAIIFPGIIQADLGEGDTMAKVGSLLVLLAMIIFFFVHLSARERGGARKRATAA